MTTPDVNVRLELLALLATLKTYRCTVASWITWYPQRVASMGLDLGKN